MCNVSFANKNTVIFKTYIYLHVFAIDILFCVKKCYSAYCVYSTGFVDSLRFAVLFHSGVSYYFISQNLIIVKDVLFPKDCRLFL